VARLIYSAITSLDGFIEDEAGNFDWAAPDDEVHAFVNDVIGPIGTHLYGRRMYETMSYWETALDDPGRSAETADFARIWQAADKVVYSSSLKQVSTPRTRLERTFDLDAIREMKSRASQDLGIGGPGLAAHAFRAGLVDEIHLFLAPIIVGGGKPSLPDDVRLKLRLIDQRLFKGTGIVHVRYRSDTSEASRSMA